MDFISMMKAKASSLGRILVLPEGTEPRMVKAARIIMDEQIAACVILIG